MTTGTEALVAAIRNHLRSGSGFGASVEDICHLAESSDLQLQTSAPSKAAVEEVVLGLAAATGSTAALQAFEARYFSGAKAALSKMAAEPEARADALAQAREVLFVGEQGRPPRIVHLLGKGDLRALVKVVAVRRLLNIQRSRRTRPDAAVEEPSDTLAAAIAREPGPEFSTIASELADLLESALRASVANLEPEARTLLRLSIIHRISVDDLAVMYGIHRSTAARRLVRIRDSLREGVRRALAERIAGSTTEVESVLRFANSQLDVSFERLLSN